MRHNPHILLHICCGPCAAMSIASLQQEGFPVTGYFYNPNIHPLLEYLQRRESSQQCAAKLNVELIYNDDWDLPAWLSMQLPDIAAPGRCEKCIEQRLQKTAQKAREMDIKAFSTTLLYSRYQPHNFIKNKGGEIAAKMGLEFVYRDFRKFWQEGIDRSKEWGLYRQKYCGCIFSESDRYSKKLKALKAS